MDAARQILRWAIPGWLFSATFFLFLAIRFTLEGQILTVSEYAQRDYAAIISLVTLLGSGGIPLGFCIYQVYFSVYWWLPLPTLIKDPKDRGYSVLKDSVQDWRSLVGYAIDDGARNLQPSEFS